MPQVKSHCMKDLLMRAAISLAVFLLLAASTTAHAETITTEAAREVVSKAIGEMRKHNPAGVIQLLEPVVAALQELQQKQVSQCADGMGQTILLSAMQAAAMKKTAQEKPQDDAKSAVVIDSAFCLAPFLKGFALIDLQRWDDAQPMLRLASESAPLDAQFRNEYAEWHKGMKQWQKAHDIFAEAYELGELETDESVKKFNQARALRGMGFTEIEMGDLEKAEESFKKSLKLIPDNQGAKSELQYIADLRKKAKG